MLFFVCKNKRFIKKIKKNEKKATEIKIDKLGYITINGEKTKRFWNGKIESKEKPLRLKIRNIAGDETIMLIK